MSHEGIRFASREEQTRQDEENRPLAKIAITPEKVRVLITRARAWRSIGSTATRARGALPGCARPARARPAWRSGSRRAASRASPSPSRPRSCPCTHRRRSPRACIPWAATPSSSTGPMATPAEFIRGSIYAAFASAGSAASAAMRPRARRIRALSKTVCGERIGRRSIPRGLKPSLLLRRLRHE